MAKKDYLGKSINVIADSELEELDDFLFSDAVPEEVMSIDMIDGFLTSLIIGPVTVLPSRWLPLVWDMSGEGKEPEFESVEQRQRLTALLMKMANRIIMELVYTDAFETLPDSGFYEIEDEKDNAVMLWAAGFIAGVLMSDSEWEEAAADKNVLTLLSAFYAFLAHTDDSMTPILRGELRELWKSIPECVRATNEIMHPDIRSELELAQEMMFTTKVARTGRNEPCPCGSGKKFKKCCGR